MKSFLLNEPHQEGVQAAHKFAYSALDRGEWYATF